MGDRTDPNNNPPTIKSCYNANIRTLTIDPNDPNTLYAGAESAVVFKSTDKGQHWQSISDSWAAYENISAIAVSKQHQGTILALSGFYMQGDLYRSTDGGSSWEQLQSGIGNNWSGGRSVAIQYNPTSNRVYLAGKDGVYISDDDGLSWQVATGTNSILITDIAINSTNSNIVYAVGSNASSNLVLLRSIDNGNTFQNVTGTSFNIDNHGAKIGVTDADGSIIYCIILTNSGPKLLNSTDSGQNWKLKSSSSQTGYEGSNTNTGLGLSNGQGFYDLAIFVAPTDPKILIVGTTTMYKSTDGGQNFSPLGGWSYGPFGAFQDDTSHSGNIIHSDVHSILGVSGDTYIATDGGIAHSTDIFTNPNNADARNNGLSAAEYYGFEQGWQDDFVVGGRYHNGDAALFEGYPTGTALYIAGAESPSGNALPGYSMTARFSDLYTTYIMPPTPSRTALKEAPGIQSNMGPHSRNQWDGNIISKLMTDPRYRNVLYLSGNRIKDGYGNTDESSILWKSTDTGVNYTSLHNFGSTVWRFDIARSNPDVIIVYTDQGLYKTTNGGSSWNPLPSPPGVTYSKNLFSDISIDPSDEKVVFLTVTNRYTNVTNCTLFKSTDGGSTWNNYTGSIGNDRATYLCTDGTNGGVYATTTFELPGKVFYRNKTMGDWVNFTGNLPTNQAITPPGAIFFRDDKIRIAGDRGVWESPLYTHPNPIAQPMASAQSVNCDQGTVNFYDYSILNYKGASWQWNFPGAATISGATTKNPTATYVTPGTYDISLTVKDASGNTNTHVVKNMIQVLSSGMSGMPTPTPIITANGPTTFCKGDSVVLSSSTAKTYLWSNGQSTQNITVSASGSYTVKTTADICTNVATSNPTDIIVKDSPQIPIISADWLMLSSSSNDNNQWYFQGAPINGATEKNYQAAQIGQYTVMATSTNGCSTVSSPYTISSLDLPTDNDFIIYPNPSDGLFHINKPSNIQITEIRVFDLFAHLVYQSRTGSTDINLSGFDPGIFFVELTTPYKTYRARKVILLNNTR